MKTFVICPGCGSIELAEIKEGIPWNTYIHNCGKCEFIIMESDWNPAKAISIRQPWAHLIAAGIKDIENRSWKTNFRGRVLIHTGAQFFKSDKSPDVFTESQNIAIKNNDSILNDLTWRYAEAVDWPFSAIIGSVEIVDCVINHPSIWAEKTGIDIHGEFKDPPYKCIYNWVLKNYIFFDQAILNVKGKQSFFIPELS